MAQASIRAQLKLQHQYDTLASDMRCLADALDEEPTLPPPRPASPLDEPAAPRPPGAASSQPGLAAVDVASLEERTFALLLAANARRLATGPLAPDVAHQAAPPPPRRRAAPVVTVHSAVATDRRAYESRPPPAPVAAAAHTRSELTTSSSAAATISELRRLPDLPPMAQPVRSEPAGCYSSHARSGTLSPPAATARVPTSRGEERD